MREQEILNREQVAERLGVSPRLVGEWALAGILPCLRLSRKVQRFEWEAVLRALRARSRRPEGARR